MSRCSKEVSINTAFDRFRTNDAFHNVKFKWTDDVLIGVNTYALASRIPDFEKMFFGNFVESRTDIVGVSFKGFVVEAVVEYIHTGAWMYLEAIDAGKNSDIELTESVISVLEAASPNEICSVMGLVIS